jgi:hypothetical protein
MLFDCSLCSLDVKAFLDFFGVFSKLLDHALQALLLPVVGTSNKDLEENSC